MINYQEAITRVVTYLNNSKSILFITGAGISADSGLPTYRGIGGLYNDQVTEDGIPVETALAGTTLESNPALTWKYLAQIEENCRTAQYNRGHEVIAHMERHFERVWVLTQNIDGFHQAAGSQKVIDIHGDMHRLVCMRCQRQSTVKDYSRIESPPRCSVCAGVIRPQVVFFGEMLPIDKCTVLERELKKGFDMYFSIGTSSLFPYIQQPIIAAKLKHRPTVEINPADTEISGVVDVKLRMRAKNALSAIWDEYLREGRSGFGS